MSGSEVKLHIECGSEGMEEAGDELGVSIGGDVGRDPVLGEDVDEEQLGELWRCDSVGGRNEDALFRETIHHDEDGGEAGGRRKLFDEVHGDGVPRFLWNRKLLECAIGFVTTVFGTHTGSTGSEVVLNEGAEVWPEILLTNEGEGLVLSIMSSKNMVMLVLENAEMEIVGVQYIQ